MRGAASADDQAVDGYGFGIRTREFVPFTLLTNTAGRFLYADSALARRVKSGALDAEDRYLLDAHGLLPTSELGRLAATYAQARRHFRPGPLDYLILVPSLRCNLACSYCQVSRASVDASGFDWSDKTLADVLQLVSRLNVPHVKIEFQGGEPTLRPDLIEAVIAAVPLGVDARFVICTNLKRLDERLLSIIARDDVSISTSFDGPLDIHTRQREGSAESTQDFLRNVTTIHERYGPNKISALPTIDPADPPDPDALIDAFISIGQSAIYLRPINYQGFARKRHSYSREVDQNWFNYHSRFIHRIIDRNWSDRSRILEESYFSLLLRRVFRPGEDRHVDLRNPNPIGRDFIVIDYDGRVYPTDEARMLARAGVIDLSIGTLEEGWDTSARAALDAISTNRGDPTCERCVYQPFCGRDIVDDIARYGRIDLPREDTDFCKRHLFLFDLAFSLLRSEDPKIQYSLRRWLGVVGECGLGLKQ